MNHCLDCQKEIQRRARRCPSCAQRHRHSDIRVSPRVDERHLPEVSSLCWSQTRGYHAGRVNGKREYLHRFVWFLEHGGWPEFFLDHINQDKTDNRLENLRPATKALNARNYTHKKKSGLPRGVKPNHNPGSPVRYQANIKRHGRPRSLGTFATIKEASQKYENALEIIEIFEQLQASEKPTVVCSPLS